MVLLSAVGIGLLVGLSKARWRGRPYYLPPLRCIWLVLVAFLPQLLVAYVTKTRLIIPGEVAGVAIVSSFTMLLAFAWLNRHSFGMPILLGGLVLNLAVIAVNGGLMPISPQTASHLTNTNVLAAMELGDRFGEKDILLPKQDMHLELLSDRFLLPDWSPYQAAFSLGDVLIGAGAFWFLVADHRKK